MRREIGSQPGLLWRARLAAPDEGAVRVEHDHVPGAELVAVPALCRPAGDSAPVAEVAGRVGRLVLVVSGCRPRAGLEAPPGRLVVRCEIAGRPVLVREVAERGDRSGMVSTRAAVWSSVVPSAMSPAATRVSGDDSVSTISCGRRPPSRLVSVAPRPVRTKLKVPFPLTPRVTSAVIQLLLQPAGRPYDSTWRGPLRRSTSARPSSCRSHEPGSPVLASSSGSAASHGRRARPGP